jgi:hypothetical protein
MVNHRHIIKVLAKITISSNYVRPIISGYRPLFSFNRLGKTISGQIELINRDRLAPGSSAEVYITFSRGIISENDLTSRTKLTFNEGLPSLVGEGYVIKVVEVIA